MEASSLDKQTDAIKTFKNRDIEIILDPKTAELATPNGISTSASRLPWANADQPHAPSDWSGRKGEYLTGLIAEFAVSKQINAVLSPAHMLQEANSPWLYIDCENVESLRRRLDEMERLQQTLEKLLEDSEYIPIAQVPSKIIQRSTREIS